MVLGAKPSQYEPSGDELVLAEAGNRIKSIVNSAPKEELKDYLEQESITREKIEYSYLTFTNFDVMGSGRYFYASDPIKEEVHLRSE